MKNKTRVLLFFTFLATIQYSVFSSTCIDQDTKEAMFDLLENNSGLKELGWNKETDIEQWVGVEVSDCSVVGIDFGEAGIRKITESISYLEKLKYVYIKDASFLKINRNFYTLPVLSSIKMTHCYLDKLDPLFARLINLKHLDISNNNFEAVPEALIGLKNLESLDISHNRLESLPAEINNLSSLRELSIAENPRVNFSPNLLNSFKKLEKLDLSGIGFDFLWFDPKILTNLRCLNISKSELGLHVPDFSPLKKLEVLTMYDCELKDLPKGLEELKQLRSLDVGYNDIGYFPDVVIENFKQLDSLKIEKNNLSRIPNIQLAVKSLKKLDISSNPIFELNETDLDNLRLVEFLDIGNIWVQSFPEDADLGKKISRLNVSKNELTRLPESITKLIKLEELNCSENLITKFPTGINKLKNLENLSFMDNKFTKIPEEIFELTNLKVLELDMEIKKVPNALVNLQKLERLSILFDGRYDPVLCELQAKGVKFEYAYINCDDK